MNTDKTIQEVMEMFYKAFPTVGDEPNAFWRSQSDQKEVLHFIQDALHKVAEEARGEVTGDTSDGYHTFDELYEFRKVYNAVLFNEWSRQRKYQVHKSKKHSDGKLCFDGGWFIVMATLPTGQISNHYELKDWELFKCEKRERADKWDGHEAKDVVKRLLEQLKA